MTSLDEAAVIQPTATTLPDELEAAPITVDAREANKALVLGYVEACDRGDIARIDALLAPEAAWWIVGRRDFDRATIMKINEGRYPPDGSRRSSILGIVAEADRVAVEYEMVTVEDGRDAYRVFHHLFVMEDGLIRSVREYLDPPPLDRPFGSSQAFPPDLPKRPARNPELDDAARTRAVALAFLTGEEPLSPALRSADFRWWITHFGYRDLDDYIAKLMKLMSSARPQTPTGPTTRDMLLTVEGDRAAVHLLKDTIFPDYDYANRFHMVVIVRDGRVVELREHNDLGAAVRGGLPALEALNA